MPDERLEGMANRAEAALWDVASQSSTETEGGVRFREQASPGEGVLITSAYPAPDDASYLFTPA
ncbi:MAG: hypothetical protein M3Z66_21750 [Chloroflexota bacterium]|nr:hypothetical protein [Chloroflexota bacterium]